MVKIIPQSFTLESDSKINRIITEVLISVYYDPRSSLPRPSFIKTTALWDTGATNSVITTPIVKNLNLTPIGKTFVKHGGGDSEHLTYLVNIALPNKIIMPSIVVTEMDSLTDNFGCIIGMDIIAEGDFAITNHGGKTCFSFRLPSMKKIDYVKEFNDSVKNLRGHDPCPCGSKNKYRNCHGKVNQ